MKFSKYNLSFDLDNGVVLLYNTITHYFISTYKVKDLYDYKESEIELLKKHGMIVNEDIDETKNAKFYIKKFKNNNECLCLWIFTTMNCNFNCYYCFEKNTDEFSDGVISEEIINKLVSKIEMLNDKNNFKKIDITFTGGEPLMYSQLISNICDSINNSSIKCNINYSIITNGSIIDVYELNLIQEHHINMVQITLDGPKCIHDKRRTYRNNMGSFDKIFNNILKLIKLKKKYDFLILIRINVDLGNVDYIYELLEYFKKYQLHRYVVFNIGDTILDYDNKTEKMLLSKILDIYDNAKLNGFNITISETQPCSMYNNYYYMISYDGGLYKCPALVGKNNSAHLNLDDVEKCFADEYIPEHECLNCELFGICLGGCKYRSNVKGNNMEKSCRKFYLKEVLKRQLLEKYNNAL